MISLIMCYCFIAQHNWHQRQQFECLENEKSGPTLFTQLMQELLKTWDFVLAIAMKPKLGVYTSTIQLLCARIYDNDFSYNVLLFHCTT